MAGDHQQTASFAQEFAMRATEARGGLSANDERILAHVREHLDELPFHTSDSLAIEIGVSRAAVVRFANRLGYDGFSELRDRARDEVKARGDSPLTRFRPDGRASLVDRKLWQDGENLAMTQILARDAIEAAAVDLSRARTVVVVGNRKSYALAVYLQRILHWVRPDVRLLDPSFPDEVADLDSRDALVACLFQRYSRLTIGLLERVGQSGAATIVVTDGGGHTFASGVDHRLVAATESPTLYQSMVAPLALLECLAAQVAAVDPERARRCLESTERFNREQGLVLE